MSDRRTVTVTMEFVERHGEVVPSGGSAELSGVPTGMVADTMFGVIEELIFHEVADIPAVQELISFSPCSDDDGTPYPLEDRTKSLVIKLLAHQMMLSRVAPRAYRRDTRSSRLSLPYNG